MKKAIVCWRPYQLLSYINMAVNDIEGCGSDTDLYLMDLPELMLVKENVVNSKLFANVYVFSQKESCNFITRKIKKAKDYITPEKAMRQCVWDCPEVVDDYGKIIASGWAYLFVFLCSINPGAEVIMGDDGVGSLVGDLRDFEVSGPLRFFCKITGRGPLSVNPVRGYVNRLELVSKNPGYKVYPYPKLDQKVISFIKDIFLYKKPMEYSGRKMIYLSADTEEVDDRVMKAFFGLLKEYGNEVIIRKHPAQTKYLDIISEYVCDVTKQIWEIACDDVVDDNTIMLSGGSTASITPWIFYDKRPSLVFLYEYLKDINTIYEPTKCFVENLREVYPGNIYVPENERQLKLILEEKAK